MRRFLVLVVIAVCCGSAHSGGWSDFVQVVKVEKQTFDNGYSITRVYTVGHANPDQCDHSDYYVLWSLPKYDELRLVLEEAITTGEVIGFQLGGCSHGRPNIWQVVKVPSVAEAFSKVAMYIFSTDFIHGPPEEYFNKKELGIFKENIKPLNAMIKQALGVQNSVGGAALSEHFKLKENLSLLRHRLLEPGRTYGWEGPDYSNEENYLLDGQYVYHSVYLQAIENLAEAKVHEVIELTENERDTLSKLSREPRHESHYWARWMMRKFRLQPEG